jgi:hypothetical protein
MTRTPHFADAVISGARRFGSALLLAFFVAGLWICSTTNTVAQTSLLANGDMELAEGQGAKLAGWISHLWDGNGTITQTKGAFLTGRNAALIDNAGPSKQAIFQRLDLPACTYRLTGAVATYGLEPGQWQQSTAVVIIGADASSNRSYPLLKGDTDWRRFELNFTLTAKQEIHLYFFNYGSGRFFVDDVKLVATEGCSREGERFTFASSFAKPLGFDPPPAPEDFALAGYCRRDDFSARDVCRKIARAPQQPTTDAAVTSPLLLADFDGRSTFAAGIPLTRQAPISGAYSALVKPDQYIAAETRHGLPENWRGYDWVRFDVHNPSATPQKLAIEIWDDKTTGYWSRVNWYTMAAPGISTLEVPLQTFVGEKSVIQERRRLDLAKIRRLVFLGTAVELRLDNVRLEGDAPSQARFPELITLDLGGPSSPLMKGFTPLSPSHIYRPHRGYGIIPGSVIARVEDRRHPDNLHRDWISFRGGGLQFDLPDGDYKILLTMEDPGYWEYYPSWRQRTIFIQGREVAVERPTYEQFLSRYFRHADDEDLPGDDIWARYIKPRYAPKEFTAKVTSGVLAIRFNGGDDPYATALSSVIIYPLAREAEGRAFRAEHDRMLKAQFDAEYREMRPSPPAAAPPPPNALDGKLWLFQRSTSVDIFATDLPAASELLQSVKTALARGEYAPLTFGLRAVGNALEVIGIDVTAPGLEVAPYKIRSKVTRQTGDGSIYRNEPRVLDPLYVTPRAPLRLSPDWTTSLLFDVYAPRTATPGTRPGLITLRFAGGTTVTIPMTITVRPWTLPEPDAPFGYLGVAPAYPDANYPELAARRDKELNDAVALLRRFGMNAVTGGAGNIGFSKYRDAKPLIDFTAADKSMAAIRRHFSGPVVGYAGLAVDGLSLVAPQDTREQHKRPYETVLKDVLGAISDHAKAQAWPPLIHVVGDEPTDEAVKDSIAAAKAIRQARPDSRTAVFTSFVDRKDPRAALAGAVDLLYVNHHSQASLAHVRASGSACSLYNRDTRYDRGVYAYRVRQLGCRGHMQFAFSSVHADPWYGLDGREDEYTAVFTHPDGVLRLALGFVRYREAVTDYRYLLALEQAIAAAPSGPEQKEAQALLANIEQSIAVGHDKPKAWTDGELDHIRTVIHDRLLALGYAGPRNDMAPAVSPTRP